MKMNLLHLTIGFCVVATSLFAQQNVSTNGIKFALLEGATATYCTACAGRDLYQDTLILRYSHLVTATIHDHYDDPMTIPDGLLIEDSMGYGANVDRAKDTIMVGNTGIGHSTSDYDTAIVRSLNAPPCFDINMSHSFNATTRQINITLNVKALQNMTGSYNTNVIVTEDNVTGGHEYDQGNAFDLDLDPNPFPGLIGNPLFGLGNPIVGFHHMHVERAMLGGAWGTGGVIADNPAVNATYAETYTYRVPTGQNVKNMKIIGLVAHFDASDYLSRYILNCVQANVVSVVNTSASQLPLREMRIFPDPAADFITITGTLLNQSETKIAVRNALGQVVYEKAFMPAGAPDFSENILFNHNLGNGVYFVQVINSGNSIIEKIVLNR